MDMRIGQLVRNGQPVFYATLAGRHYEHADVREVEAQLGVADLQLRRLAQAQATAQALAACTGAVRVTVTDGPVTATARPTAKREKIGVVCLECGKRWKVGPNASPECPKCGGTDFDVREG